MKGLFIQVRYHIQKGMRDEFYRRFRDNNIREFSRSEAGNIEYEIYLPLDSDDDVCLLEKWDNEESFKKHMRSLHYVILSELKTKFVVKAEVKKYWLEPCD